jgi:hypothetical protein
VGVRIALGRLWWAGLSRGCPLSLWVVALSCQVCTDSLGVYV